jgi:transcriptional regulator with XRE-family HTH domain
MPRKKYKQNDLVLYRRRMGFTQDQVSRLLGHGSTSRISHYEQGRALPPLKVALSLEIIYRTPVAFLFPGVYDELKDTIRADEELIAAAPGQQALPLTQHPHDVTVR